MAKIRIVGDSSGYVELSAPNAAGNNTLELPSNATKLVGADESNNVNVGIITATNIFASNASIAGNVNASGISTFNNVVVGGATTALVVTGNTRITGILTVGTGSITFDGTNNIISGVSSITDNVGGYLTIPPGAIQFFARNTAPTGWLKANGANISRSAYAILFNAVGTTFGSGDGSTTFTLPDMRGEFPRGWDDGRGIDSGRGFGTAQSHLLKNHQHPSMPTSGGTPIGVTFYSPHPGGGAVNLANTDQNSRNPYSDTASWNTGNPGTIGGTGVFSADSGAGSETRPRNIALLACIKY